MSSRESSTPDAIELRELLSLSRSEALERTGWDEETYERVIRDVEPMAAAVENREGQSGQEMSALVHLGTRFGVRLDQSKSGLIIPRRANHITRI